MADAIYKKVQYVGTSTQSVTEAINNAIKQASQTEKNLSWFEVTEIRGAIADGKVGQYQVTVNIGCRVLQND